MSNLEEIERNLCGMEIGTLHRETLDITGEGNVINCDILVGEKKNNANENDINHRIAQQLL